MRYGVMAIFRSFLLTNPYSRSIKKEVMANELHDKTKLLEIKNLFIIFQIILSILKYQPQDQANDMIPMRKSLGDKNPQITRNPFFPPLSLHNSQINPS